MLRVVPNRVHAGVHCTAHIGGKGVADDNAFLRLSTGNMIQYIIKVTLVGFSGAGSLRDEIVLDIAKNTGTVQTGFLRRSISVCYNVNIIMCREYFE